MFGDRAASAEAVGMVPDHLEGEAAASAAATKLLRLAEMAREVRKNPHQHALVGTPEKVYAAAVVAFLLENVEGHIS